jgi:hypothetical protein
VFGKLNARKEDKKASLIKIRTSWNKLCEPKCKVESKNIIKLEIKKQQ